MKGARRLRGSGFRVSGYPVPSGLWFQDSGLRLVGWRLSIQGTGIRIELKETTGGEFRVYRASIRFLQGI